MTNTSQSTSMNRITRQQLELINRKTLQYPLPIAEKDYFLALAIQRISDSPLRNKLIYKGGTALHHCYLKQHRFSEDLDFTSLDPNITSEEIISVLEKNGLFKAKKSHISNFTIKIERLQYQGLLGQPGNIKLEVDHKQNVILPGKEVVYKNVWRVPASPLVMDQQEMCAEKIRAVSQRARYRDFYDLYLLVNELKINFVKAIGLLEKKEIRSPITATNLVENWEVAKEQQERDLGSIYCSHKIANEKLEVMVQNISFEDVSN